MFIQKKYYAISIIAIILGLVLGNAILVSSQNGPIEPLFYDVPPVADAGPDQLNIVSGTCVTLGTPATPGHTYDWSGPSSFTASTAQVCIVVTETTSGTYFLEEWHPPGLNSGTDDVEVSVCTGGPTCNIGQNCCPPR